MNDFTSYKFPTTPSMPLFALSPERVNAQRQAPQHKTDEITSLSPSAVQLVSPSREFGHPEFGTPGDFSKFNVIEDLDAPPSPTNNRSYQENTSPSLGKFDLSHFSPSKHGHIRTSSDVQGMVARFNSLDIKDHAELRKRDAAALKRAQMGREEAEAELKLYKEGNRTMKKEIEEGKDRERRVMKRIDVLMEDLHRSKETQAHAQNLYEKEIRKARKEAFKSSSAMVKLQEEMKAAKNALKVAKQDLEMERMKSNQRDQDAFNAQYQIVGVQEELAKSQEKVKIVEEERDALKTSLQEEEVARVAAEGMIALPTLNSEDTEFSSPKKQRTAKAPQTSGSASNENKLDSDQLRDELEDERVRREAAEEYIAYLKMECQFGCCSCRIAEQRGTTFTYDNSFEAEVRHFNKISAEDAMTPPDSVIEEEELKSCDVAQNKTCPELPLSPQSAKSEDLPPREDVAFSPNSGTFHAIEKEQISEDPEQDKLHDVVTVTPPIEPENGQEHVRVVSTPDVIEIDQSAEPANPCVDEHPAQGLETEQNEARVPDTETQRANEQEQQAEPGEEPNMLEHESSEQLPSQSFRTFTTTTKVPLVDASTPDYSAFCSPMHLTREEAIEQLRQRRGRARSVTGTPKKPVPESQTPRRDISAPEIRKKATPRSVSRGRLFQKS